MTIIHILNHQTGKLIGHLDSESEKFFWDAKHVHGLDGEHSQQFTMPADLEEAALLEGRTRFLIPLEDGGFEEFIQFESDTQMEDEKTVYGTPYYKDMDKKYILSPGKYTGTVEELAKLVLPFVKHVIGVVEDIRVRTITVDRHIGAYSFLEKISSEFNLEKQFRITTAGSRITGRFVDFLKRVGADTRKEIVLGKDLLAINKKEHSERIVTGLFCIGPEREDGSRLTTTILDPDAFQRWNEDGEHIIDIYEPESADSEMTLAQLEQYGRTELNKRIASIFEYTVTAASLEELFPHEKVRLGDGVRLKNPEFSPPLYADARVIRIERSLTDPDAKTYDIGEIVTYDEDEVFRTFRQLQAQYNLRVIRSAERPEGGPTKIWVEIILDATGKPTGVEVPHVWSTELNDWVKIAPTTAAEIGAETPEGAKQKADAAEKAAKDHAEQEDKKVREDVDLALDEQKQIINQNINQTRIELESDLAAKAGLTYVDGKFGLIDSELSAMLGDINMITGDFSGISSRVDGLQAVSDDLQTRVGLNEAELLAGNGRMTTIETDIDDIAGTLSATITTLSNIEGTITNQQTQINANATAITLKASQAELNTLSGAVSNISSELSVQAGKIALKAEASALTTVDGRVTGLRTDLSALTVRADGITSSVSSLRTDLDGLEIGGRNLLLSSNNIKNHWTESQAIISQDGEVIRGQSNASPNPSWPRIWNTSTRSIVFDTAADYTLSFEVRADRERSLSYGIMDAGGRDAVLNASNNMGTDWRKVVRKFRPLRSGSTSYLLNLQFYTGGTTGDLASWIELRNVKLEKGNRATDWTPAPEDVDAAISSVQQFASTVDQKADSIISNVSALTQTVNGHTTSITNAQSSIAQLSDSIVLKAEKTQVDAIGSQVTNVSNEVSQIKVDVSGVTSNVSNLRSDLNGLSIGARNLLVLNTLTTGRFLTSVGNITTLAGWNITDFIPVIPGAQYIASGYRNLGSGPSTVFYNSNKEFLSGISNDNSGGAPANDKRRLVTAPANAAFLRFSYEARDDSTIKLEKGNKATDWTPAPEDTDASIAAVSSRVTSAETSITQLSNSITLKANQTSLDSLAGRMSTAEASLSVIPGQIAAKVAQTDFNALSGRVSSAESQITQNATAITSRVTTTAFNEGMASKEGTVFKQNAAPAHAVGRLWLNTSVTPNVLNRSTGSAWVKATATTAAEVGAFSSADGGTLAGRVSTTESSITQMAGQISSKVSTTDYTGNKIASLINQTATTISIQASKINLVGAVNVLSEISGQLGNITAGTISGVTFTSVSGRKSFTLSNGLAEFIEDRSSGGVTLGTRTAINEDGVKVEYTYYGVVEQSSHLRATGLMLKGEGAPYTEYGMDRIELLAGGLNAFAIYPNPLVTTIESSRALELKGSGHVLRIGSSTLTLNGSPIGFSGSEILWSGGWLMSASESVYPSMALSNCPTGWILVWSRYVNGSPSNSDWNFTFIPKLFTEFGGGSWHSLPATGSGSSGVAPPVSNKYMYATNTRLYGHARNTAGTDAGQCLRYVLAY